MEGQKGSNFKLGGFVLVGTVVLVLALYLLGSKRDMFSDTMDVSVTFKEVSGLRKGNNVRFAGIDVGTVKGMDMKSDTEVVVHMVVRMSAAEHIRRNAVARIGSDGLMGNKLVSIEPGEGDAPPIEEGDVLRGGTPLDTDAMLRTLSRSNENLAEITTDLRVLVRRIRSDNSLLSLLDDSTLVTDVEMTMGELRAAATTAHEITERVNAMVVDVGRGQGAIGAMLNDPAAEQHVRQLLGNLRNVSDSLLIISARIDRFSKGLDEPGGLGHTLTRDTAVAADMRRVISRLDTSSVLLNEDLRALQRNWFFRRYFEEQEKEAKRSKKKD